jgi:hypothetical protein
MMDRAEFEAAATLIRYACGGIPTRDRERILGFVAYAETLVRLVSQHVQDRAAWTTRLNAERERADAAEERLRRVHEAVLQRIDPDFTFADSERNEP